MDLTNITNLRMFYRQIFVLGVGLFILWLVWTTWEAILPYVVGLLLAYLLTPLVRLLERYIPGGEKRAGLRRMVAVLVIYFIFFGALIFLLLTLGEKIVNETASLMEGIDEIYNDAIAGNTTVQRWYQDNVPDEFHQKIEQNLDANGKSFADWIETPLTSLLSSVSSVFGIVFTLLFIPLFMFYLLIERPTASDSISSHFPEAWKRDIIEIGHIINDTIFSYFRGLTMEGLILGTATGIALWLIGVDFPIALGFITGLAVFIPFVGFWFAFLATIVVVMATEPSLLVPALIVSGILQVIDNWYLAPKFKGGAVGFTPAQTLFLIAIGAALFGAVGVIIITPVAAVFRDVVFYIYNRLSQAEDVVVSAIGAGDSGDAEGEPQPEET